MPANFNGADGEPALDKITWDFGRDAASEDFAPGANPPKRTGMLPSPDLYGLQEVRRCSEARASDRRPVRIYSDGRSLVASRPMYRS
jgi:hypothetical protein